jgi:hypothetical protein
MPSSSFVLGGFPLSSRSVVKFPIPFQAFPSSPFEFISGAFLFGSFFVSPSFGPLPLLSRSLFFFVPFPPVLQSIYRAKGRGFLWLHMGSKGCGGWSAIWVQLSRFRSLFFRVGARRVVGQCLWSVVQRRGASGWWPRGERDRFKEEKPFFFLLLHRVQ